MANTQNIPSGWFDVTDARHPRWSDASRRTITLDVLFGWCRESGTYIPFTASPDDGEVHGRRLFADAQTGKYGEVAPPPTATAKAVQAEMALRIREATAALNALGVRQETLQDALDLGMGGDDTQVALDAIGETVQAWKKYRVQVSQVPAQAAYPQNVAWPDAPEVTAENEAVRGKADE
ncbi:phage tail assembly chaperone [Pluralibacter gergoviae]|nr:phage tail assembly chaperone [Pluralibacter gergoviae]